MKIIISPAKKMKINNSFLSPKGLPIYLNQAQELYKYLEKMNSLDLKKLFLSNDKIAYENYLRYKTFEFKDNLTPAILAYDGIMYKYMAPDVFSNDEFTYVSNHLYILSGLYGILRALDGIYPYRLEMQAKLKMKDCNNLYEFWQDYIYKELFKDNDTVICLCSLEYRKCIEKYLKPKDSYVVVYFYETVGTKLIEKAVYAKIARGRMVRYMAEHKINKIEELKAFSELGYVYKEELSNSKKLVFVRKKP